MFFKQVQSKLGQTQEDRRQNANKLINQLNTDFNKTQNIEKKLNNAILTMQSEFTSTEYELQQLKKHVQYATSFKEPLLTKDKVALKDQKFLAEHSSKPLDEAFDELFKPEYRKEYGVRGTTKAKEFKRLYSPDPPTTQQKMKYIVKNANIYNKYIRDINKMYYSTYSKYEIDFDILAELEHQAKATNNEYFSYYTQGQQNQSSESESDKLDIIDLETGSQTHLEKSQYKEEVEQKAKLYKNKKLRDTANKIITFLKIQIILVKIKQQAKILQMTDKNSQFYMNWKNELLSRKHEITERLKYIPGAPVSCYESKV